MGHDSLLSRIFRQVQDEPDMSTQGLSFKAYSNSPTVRGSLAQELTPGDRCAVLEREEIFFIFLNHLVQDLTCVLIGIALYQ